MPAEASTAYRSRPGAEIPIDSSRSGAGSAFLDLWTPRVLSLVRIITALLFVEHGLMKLIHFPAAVPGLPEPLPPLLLAAGLIEVIAGILIAAGLFTRVAAVVCSGEMAAAYFMVHAPMGFWPAVNQGEPAILFCFIFLYFAFAGPGAWSLGALLAKKRDRAG